MEAKDGSGSSDEKERRSVQPYERDQEGVCIVFEGFITHRLVNDWKPRQVPCSVVDMSIKMRKR